MAGKPCHFDVTSLWLRRIGAPYGPLFRRRTDATLPLDQTPGQGPNPSLSFVPAAFPAMFEALVYNIPNPF